jgi:hypothetical protein
VSPGHAVYLRIRPPQATHALAPAKPQHGWASRGVPRIVAEAATPQVHFRFGQDSASCLGERPAGYREDSTDRRGIFVEGPRGKISGGSLFRIGSELNFVGPV